MPLPRRNNFQQSQDRNAEEASRPDDKAWNAGYGRVYDIDEQTYQVKVQLRGGRFVGNDPAVGDFIPLMNDLSDVLLRYGPLRKNLIVRVTWRGQQPNRGAVAEIIGDEDSDFLKQLEIDEGGVGAYRIFSPGLV